MAVFLLTSFTMIAFAANSVLTRMAVEGGHIDPLTFAILRVLAGAGVLTVLVLSQGGQLPLKGRARLLGAASLSVYMIGFSMAYITLDAGIGALILFAVVQITMFSHAAAVGTRPTSRQFLGAGVAFIGLLTALWPGADGAADTAGAAYMALAGLGWAVYTICGRSSKNPLASTAANFCICLPILVLCLFPWISQPSLTGVLLAAVLGYALWYRVLPDLQQSVAAVVQLSVPIIAIISGALLLGETLSGTVLAAAALVVAGIGLAVTSRSVRADRS